MRRGECVSVASEHWNISIKRKCGAMEGVEELLEGVTVLETPSIHALNSSITLTDNPICSVCTTNTHTYKEITGVIHVAQDTLYDIPSSQERRSYLAANPYHLRQAL